MAKPLIYFENLILSTQSLRSVIVDVKGWGDDKEHYNVIATYTHERIVVKTCNTKHEAENVVKALAKKMELL